MKWMAALQVYRSLELLKSQQLSIRLRTLLKMSDSRWRTRSWELGPSKISPLKYFAFFSLCKGQLPCSSILPKSFTAHYIACQWLLLFYMQAKPRQIGFMQPVLCIVR